MSIFSSFIECLHKLHPRLPFSDIVRHASKKAGTSTKNTSSKCRPKHRGWKKQDGHVVTGGSILATQNRLRWMPGLNVGIGRNLTLFAIIPGRVVVTCETMDPNWNHPWIMRFFKGREDNAIFKKYYNIIPEPQHNNFKLIDEI